MDGHFIINFVVCLLLYYGGVQVLSTGQRVEMAAPINLLHKISYRQCAARCSEWSDCQAARYYRLMTLCKLFRDTRVLGNEEKDVSFSDYIKPNDLIRRQIGYPSNPQLYCGEPRQIRGTTLYGNMRSQGSKLKYVCVEDRQASAITECRDGHWSEVDLYCICGNYTFGRYQGNVLMEVKEHNETHVEGELTCADEMYELRMADVPVCDIITGTWTGLEYACCDIMHSGPWTKVHKWSTAMGGSLARPWLTLVKRYNNANNIYTTNDDIGEHCFYRNSTAAFNWAELNVQRVNLTILKDNERVVFMTFSGVGSNHTSWFGIDTLQSSSFLDLTQDSFDQDAGVFSIEGFGTRRYLVANMTRNNSNRTMDNCLQDSGWLVVSKKYYPCDLKYTHRIVYAKNYTRSRFTREEMDFADTLEIWIETGESSTHDEL